MPIDPHASATPETQDSIKLVLYGHADCSLCDRLEAMIESYLQAPRQNVAIYLAKRDITSNPEWYHRYRTRIPVLTCDDRVILEGRPDRDQVAQALSQLG